jgi:Fe/S biogenesis protein NfuA
VSRSATDRRHPGRQHRPAPGRHLDLLHRGQGGLGGNPNRPNPLAGIDLELTGDLAEKVTQLLDQSINPSLASHGGFASLVGVEGTACS